MDAHTKKTYMVYDTAEICSYLKMANVFTSDIFIKHSTSYEPLENTGIAKVDKKKNLFFLNRDLDLTPSLKRKTPFRIKLESAIIDFTSALLPSQEDEEAQLFSLPKQMTVQYLRSYQRVEPTKDHPINIRFSVNRLSLKFKVLDISSGGMAMRVPNVDLLLDIGDILENMELILNKNDQIKISGQIRFIEKDRCSIKFIDITPQAEKTIVEYMERRKLVDVVREKLYMDIEDEVMKFEKD